MELNRRDFLRLGIGGLSSLVLEQNLFTEETKPGIITPSLEEITGFLSKNHNTILEPEIENGRIKKFEYKRQTRSDDVYSFLNRNFKNKIVFVYLEMDNKTDNKNIWGKEATGDERLASGSATVFLYTMLNLQKSKTDVGFLFLELTDFYGDENWNRLKALFDNRLKTFPSYVEFIREEGNYEFEDIKDSSMREPELILKYIKILSKHYAKESLK